MSVYNGEKYLREAVDSIINQTFKDFEFIIVDDGSTDSSVKKILSFDDPRIKLIHNNQNRGISFSLNLGVENAQGKYIARMDSDDICLSTRFEKQIAFLEKNPNIDVVGSCIAFIDAEGNDTGKHYCYPSEPVQLKWMTLFQTPFAHPAIMARKEFFIDSDGYTLNGSGQDFELWNRRNFYSNYSNLQESLLKHRIHEKKVSTLDKEGQKNATYRIISRNLSSLIGQDVTISDVEIIRFQKEPNNICELFRIIILLNKALKEFSSRTNLTFFEKLLVVKNLTERKIELSKIQDNRIFSQIVRLGFKVQLTFILIIKKLMWSSASKRY